jgi:putative transposase
MPNHYHLVLREITEDGITKFMQKLGTAYTMYFNTRYHRTGNLFVKPFRSRHVDTDNYFQYLINYVHCNPAVLFEHEWKTGTVRDINTLAEKLIQYPYSSFGAYEDKGAQTYTILDESVFEITPKIPIEKILREAQEYYSENPELP